MPVCKRARLNLAYHVELLGNIIFTWVVRQPLSHQDLQGTDCMVLGTCEYPVTVHQTRQCGVFATVDMRGKERTDQVLDGSPALHPEVDVGYKDTTRIWMTS